MDACYMSGQTAPQEHQDQEVLRHIRQVAEQADLRLALFRSALRSLWGDWFVATPERLKRLDAELYEVVKLIEEIERCTGVPPGDLERCF
jgi:hypothetical protein